MISSLIQNTTGDFQKYREILDKSENKISCTFRESLQSFQDQTYELHNFTANNTIF